MTSDLDCTCGTVTRTTNDVTFYGTADSVTFLFDDYVLTKSEDESVFEKEPMLMVLREKFLEVISCSTPINRELARLPMNKTAIQYKSMLNRIRGTPSRFYTKNRKVGQ